MQRGSAAIPVIQYDTTINDWHTSANTDRIYASNPCSEYMFLNDTACFAPETRISTPKGLRTVEDLFLAQERGEEVLVTTDLHGEHDHRRLTAHRPAHVTLVGERPVHRMTLRDGRVIRTTGDHRFLTDTGEWKRVDELRPGQDRIAIRESGNPVGFESSDADVRRWQMLGWLTGDGVFSKDIAALVFGPQERETAEAMADEFRSFVRRGAGPGGGAYLGRTGSVPGRTAHPRWHRDPVSGPRPPSFDAGQRRHADQFEVGHRGPDARRPLWVQAGHRDSEGRAVGDPSRRQ